MVPLVRGFITTFQFLTHVIFTTFFVPYYTIQSISMKKRDVWFCCVLFSSLIVSIGYTILAIIGYVFFGFNGIPTNCDLILIEITTHILNLMIPLFEYIFVAKHNLRLSVKRRALTRIICVFTFYLTMMTLLGVFGYLDEIPYIGQFY